MVDLNLKELYWKSHVDKQLRIATDDGLFVATNRDIHFEDFELAESLCSESELRFGSCEASSVKFQIRNAFIPLIGKWITITETLGGNADAKFQFGRYKVFSDVPTADKEYRDIVAYDSMYDILNADVSAWYDSVLPNENSKLTMKKFRESFVRHFGLTEVVPGGGLANDEMTVSRTISPEQISGKDVINAICEINGCFGHIGRDGKFHYIYLPQDIQGLYPADFLFPDRVPERWDYLSQAETGHLYPQDPKGTRMGTGRYIKCQYEDYVVRTINKLQIRMEENDIGVIHGVGDNCYIIEDNFLVYGKSGAELEEIAKNVFEKIRGTVYRPFDAECVGNPCFEVGDPVRLITKYEIVESYILQRTLKGIQALRDDYRADGVERYAEKVNGVHKSIIQLKGKTNVITRTVEENRMEMIDITDGLSNTITVTAAQIRTELSNEVKGLNTKIEITAGEIRTEMSNTATGLSNRITANAEGIAAEITRATKEEGNLSNRIKVTADGLSAEITRASTAEGNLSTRITANAEGITTKVTKGTISSEISQEAGLVSIKSNRLVVESKQFVLDADGNAVFGGTLYAANGSFKGYVEATHGYFDNVEIRSSCTVAGQSITGTIGNSVNWNGSQIGDGYLSGISGSKVGYGVNGAYVGSGINAGNVTSGTLGLARTDTAGIFALMGTTLIDKIWAGTATIAGYKLTPKAISINGTIYTVFTGTL